MSNPKEETPKEDRFAQPGESITKVEPNESFRDLTPKQQRERMRVMYRDVQIEEKP